MALLALLLAPPWPCRWEQAGCSSPHCPPATSSQTSPVLWHPVWGEAVPGSPLKAHGSRSSAQVHPDSWLCPTIHSLRSTLSSQSFSAQLLLTAWKREMQQNHRIRELFVLEGTFRSSSSKPCFPGNVLLKGWGDCLPSLVWHSLSS